MALMKMDQLGLSAGTSGAARRDGLDTGAVVTLTDMTAGGTTLFEILWVDPTDGSAVASLAPTGDTHVWQFTPEAGVQGPIRIRLTHTTPLNVVTTQTRIFGIPDDDGIVSPAPGERSDPNATLLNATDLGIIDRCERNWPTADFPAGNPFGWGADILALIAAAVAAGGGTPDPHAPSHQNGGTDEINVAGLSGQLADPQLIRVAKGGTNIGLRPKLNLIEGTNVTLTVADNNGADRVDITITAAATAQTLQAAYDGGQAITLASTALEVKAVSGDDVLFLSKTAGTIIAGAKGISGGTAAQVAMFGAGAGVDAVSSTPATSAAKTTVRGGKGGDGNVTALSGGSGSSLDLLGGDGGSCNSGGLPGDGGAVLLKAGKAGAGPYILGGPVSGVTIEGGDADQTGPSSAQNTRGGAVSINGGLKGLAGKAGIINIGTIANKTEKVVSGSGFTPWIHSGVMFAALVTAADNGTIVTINPNASNTHKVALTGNRSITVDFGLATPGVTMDGATFRLTIKQDASGGRTLTWSAPFVDSPVINTAALAVTLIECVVEDGSHVYARVIPNTLSTGDLVGPASSVSGNLLSFNGTTGKLAQDSGLGAAVVSTALTNDRTASGIRSATTVVAVSAATAPTTGQVLTATGASAAAWQTPTGGAASDLATTGANVNVSGAAPPSAGQVLTAVDATHSTWQSPAGSVAGADPLWAIPSSPNADDEEFDNVSMPAGWEVYNESDSVVITPSGAIDPYSALTANDSAHMKFHTDWRKSFFTFQGSTEAGSKFYTFTKPVTVPANRTIWARLGFYERISGQTTDSSFGILFTTNSGGHGALLTNSVVFEMLADAINPICTGKLVAGAFTQGSTGPSTVGGAGTRWDYLAIHKRGTNYDFWTYTDAGQSHYWGATTHASTFARIGFFMRCGTSISPGNTIYRADFLRCIDSATQLPA